VKKPMNPAEPVTRAVRGAGRVMARVMAEKPDERKTS
jgi:hypothetical protein